MIGDIMTLSRHGGCQEYIEESIENKISIAKRTTGGESRSRSECSK